ncbi:MAG TPA: hypothetical protein VF228_10300 [Iamia sp.]
MAGRGISIDLTGPARAVGRLVPQPVRAAVTRAGRIAERLDPTFRTQEHPEDGAIHGCSVPCRATVVGLADLPGLREHDGLLDRVLIRMAVDRPDGSVEVCVRQHVPGSFEATIGPGTELPALADPVDRSRAVVRWNVPPGGFWERAQFAFPPPPEWPAAGRIEVRDRGRQAQQLAERRATWSSVWARPGSIGKDRGRVAGRPEHDVDLELATGGVARSRERIPILARARISTATWVPALTDGRDVCVDWEAFLNLPGLTGR